MAFVDLSLLKKHVRADDFEDDDEYLSSILEAAGAWVVESTARTEDELLELGGGSLPPQLRQAVLLVAGHWYNQREAVSSVSMSEVPYTVQALVKPFRKLVADTEETGTPEPDTATFTIVPEPGDATVVIGGIERQSVAVEVGTEVSWSVSADGYYTRRGTVAVDGDISLPVKLTEKDGVSVAYTDSDGIGRICAPSEWNEGLGTAAGVLVEDGEHSILIAPTGSESTMQWGLYNVAVEGAVMTNNGLVSRADYAGRTNTAAEVAAGAGAEEAAGWCDAYSNGNTGAGAWWLPACGELETIRLRLAAVNAALATIGGEEIPGESHWSSTQYSATSSYPMNMSTGSSEGGTRTNTYLVRAVSEWNYGE